jgi:hypothetical protein
MKLRLKKMMSVLIVGAISAVILSGSNVSFALVFSDFPAPSLLNTTDQIDNYLNSSPDLLSYQFTKPADSPIAPGDIFSPSFGDKPSAGTATISSATAEAKPSRSIIIQGENFKTQNALSKVWVFGQTTKDNGSYYSAGVLLGDNNTITATLADNKPYGLYLAWVGNEKGLSYPVRINAAKVLWISDTTASVGKEVSLYGDNLSYQNDEKISYVYLRPWGADSKTKSIKANVIRVNPHKVTFVIPSGLKADKEYEVWLHNGHGGDYGWSGPQKIKISGTEQFSFKGKKIDVTKYGANANDKNNDDTAAIIRAVNDAKNGDIIYFPNGTYNITSTICVDNKSVYFKGENKEKTIIYSDKGFTKPNVALFRINGAAVNFSDLNFIDEKSNKTETPNFIYYQNNSGKLCLGGVVTNCNFEKESRGPNYAYMSMALMAANVENLTVSNCTMEVPAGMYFSGCNRIFVYDNVGYGNWLLGDDQGPSMVQFETGSMFDVHGNTISSKDAKTDPNGTLSFGDYCFVRGVVAQLHAGTGKNYYIAENTFDRVGNPANNSGEVIMFENPFQAFEDKPQSVSEKEIVLPIAAPKEVRVGSVVTIVNGKGEGQSREIKSIEGSIITMLTPWDIQPDTTSRIMITNPFLNSVIYKNKITGFKTFNDKTNAGCGIQAYGNMINLWITKNNFSQLITGIRLTAQYTYPPDNTREVPYSLFSGTIVENNTITDTRNGIMMLLVYSYMASSESIPARVGFNTVIRDNKITNAKLPTESNIKDIGGDGITVGTEYKSITGINMFYPGNWIKNTVVELNTISNAENAYIRMQQHQGTTIVRGNKITGAGSDTRAIVVDPGAEKAVLALVSQPPKDTIMLEAEKAVSSVINKQESKSESINQSADNPLPIRNNWLYIIIGIASIVCIVGVILIILKKKKII